MIEPPADDPVASIGLSILDPGMAAVGLAVVRRGEAVVDSSLDLGIGDKVRLGWAAGASHFFDGATQLRREVDHQPATMVA